MKKGKKIGKKKEKNEQINVLKDINDENRYFMARL